MNTKQILYDNVSIHYRESGTGPTLVFLHGFFEDGRIWDHVIANLINDYRILIVDMPGFGDSELGAYGWTLTWMADIINAIFKKEQISKATMYGHSMGGYISLEFAEKYSDKLSGLCIVHSHPYADSPEKKAQRYKAIDLVKRHGSSRYANELFKTLFTSSFLKEKRDLFDDLLNRAKQYSNETIIQALAAMAERKDNMQVLVNLSIPVAFVVGKQDPTLELGLSLRQCYQANISQLFLLADAGHMGMFECPEQLASSISEFAENVNSLKLV